MTPQEFCYWLQGFFELCGEDTEIDAEKSEIIQQHLALVFTQVTAEARVPVSLDDVRRIVGERTRGFMRDTRMC